MDANGERILLPSRQSLSKAKPRCLSARHPKADTSLRIFGGSEDKSRWTDPILAKGKQVSKHCAFDVIEANVSLAYPN
jgi:hypothetical protein